MPVSTPAGRATLQVMPDDHSKLVPPLPIPNRTVKRLCADDSVHAHVKVGYRQACDPQKPSGATCRRVFALKNRFRQTSSLKTNAVLNANFQRA